MRIIGDGRNRWSTVDVDDLADLYLRALLAPNAAGTCNAGSSDATSMRDVAETIAAALGPGIAVGGWSVDDAIKRLGPLMPMMPLEQRINSRRVYAELGWVHGARTPLDDLCAGSYRTAPLVRYSH